MTDRPIIGVSAIVFDDADRVLVVQRAKPPSEGLWSVPGGKLERGETIAEGIAREVKEETGLEVEVGARIEILERIGQNHHYVIHSHAARVVGGSLAPNADEVRAARWVTNDELASLATTDGLTRVIAMARAVKG
jgi:ADP-ribose pyrophosphatase YjhB (NUDIX family)